MRNNAMKGLIFAILAAIFYSINVPFSKLLLADVPETLMASFLYLGAGIGVSLMYLFKFKNEPKSEQLVKNDVPYTMGMIALDIIAPIFLMIGINKGTAANASLLSNFEIVATSIIALVIFKEKISIKLWTGIIFILLSCSLLSVKDSGTIQFSIGSIFVILATICWGLENNCTKKISSKSTYQIVILKGIGSGIGSLIIAFVLKEKFPEFKYLFLTMLLGFIAYGLSIFTYVRAQRYIGAAKTSAFYSIAPFIGVFISFIFFKERISYLSIISFILMLAGVTFVSIDVLAKQNCSDNPKVIPNSPDNITNPK